MDIYSLKEYIKDNPELIELILDKSGFTNISNKYAKGEEYRCSWTEDGDPTKVRVNIYSLNSSVFGENIKGDIITLVQSKLFISLSKAIKLITEWVNFEDTGQYKHDLPFGGIYKSLKKLLNSDEYITYSDDELCDFLNIPSMMFYEDSIDSVTQSKFGIGYDLYTDRITIPWRDVMGQLVGVMGRRNGRIVDDEDNKYLPIIKFYKSNFVYGLSENYEHIQSSKRCYIGEAEKFTLQLHSNDIKLGLSLGGSNLSENQANNIKSLMCDEIYLCMDEGIDEEICKTMASKLKMNKYITNKVYYVYDRDNKYLLKDSKMSPSDLNKSDFLKLINECSIEYLEEG